MFIGNETTNIDGKAVKAGDVLTYRIRYKNTTGKEQKVVITDMIPKHTEYVEKSVSEGGNYVNGVVIWTKENLAPGEVFEVSFKVKVKEVEREEMLRNEATVRADENDIRTNITENPVKPNDKPKSPKTGDNSNIMLSVSLLALATGVLVLMESKRRREYSDD